MDKTIALYMRLSDEDDNLAAHEESNSISHQRKLMLDHIQKLPELKYCNIMEFSDDGYSGADFNRPNFVKMMDLVKAGKIQVIVTKDYSRLGRDYLEVGNYMECIFPVLQVRYISVNDNYDSANSFGSTGGMSVALKNLVNALYCKDASKKVRAKHVKPSMANQQGGIVHQEGPIDASNVMFLHKGKATRVGFKMDGDKKVRFAKSTGDVID